LRPARGKLRLRLRDVGARHLAHIEAIAGLLQRLFENADVAALNLNDGGVAQIIHVNSGGREQHRLFENPQRFARARDLALRRTGSVGGLLAVEERLRHRGADAARRVGAVNFGSHDCGGRAARGGVGVGILITGAAGDRDFRTIAR